MSTVDDRDRLDIDRIDRIWDRIATGGERHAADRDEDAMTETMLHLHHLHGLGATSQSSQRAVDRTWARTAPLVAAPGHQPRSRSRPARIAWAALGSRPVSAVATLGLIVLIAVSGYLAILPIGANQPATPVVAPTPNYRLLVAEDHGMTLREIDPLTLADRPNGTRLSFARSATPVAESGAGDSIQWTASADGSTLVGMLQERFTGTGPYTPGPITVIVVDAATGQERRRFDLPSQIAFGPKLNGDGTRFAVQIDGGWQSIPPPTSVASFVPPKWEIYDATTGQRLSTVTAIDDRDPMTSGSGWLDRSGGRFYWLAVVQSAQFGDPWTVQLVAHDAASGQEVARIDLPGVIARYGPPILSTNDATCVIPSSPTASDPAMSSSEDWQTERPAVELSPDGTTMAIVNSRGEQLTLVDLGTMQITTTTALDSQMTTATPVPVADGLTSCAETFDHGRYGSFSADGTQLFVSGFSLPSGDDPDRVPTDATFVRIDLASGVIMARAARPPHEVPYVLPNGASAPDGESVYLSAYDLLNQTGTLQRLDAATLAVEAERASNSLAEISQIMIVGPAE